MQVLASVSIPDLNGKKPAEVWSTMFPFLFLKDICKATTTASVNLEMVKTAKITATATEGHTDLFVQRAEYAQCEDELATYMASTNVTQI